jgi:nudix-type nucleoside diphosphatase (YffH/AdpP family)
VNGHRVRGDAALQAAVLGDPPDARRLDFYARVLGLTALDGTIDLGPGGPEAEALAWLILRDLGQRTADEQRARLGSLRVEAASRLRARTVTDDRAVRVLGDRPAHAGFFGLRIIDLSHHRFDGGMSPRITREVFVSGDAVTVLPYDPVRDRVLLIEQFRAGPLGRGDGQPWQLEAVAGRIDPGETPEAAARREAVEEAGLQLGRLEPVASYYPSPGAVTEYLYSYVGLCDLADGVAGVFGAEAEAEDIRGHLLSFDGFMALLAEGRVTNAPLLLTALWLQRERGRLRAAG